MEETEKKQDEVEISLVELVEELKRCWRAVVAVAVVCGAAAAVYTYATLAPIYYVYDARLQLPLNTGAWQVNTCIEILKNDLGSVPGFVSVWQAKKSSVLILSFRGLKDSELKVQAEEYLPKAKAKVDDFLLGQQWVDFERSTLKEIQRDMADLATSGESKVVTRLADLQAIVATKSARTNLFPPSRIIMPHTPRRIEPSFNLGSNVMVAGLGGLLLGCGYFIVCYLYKKMACV